MADTIRVVSITCPASTPDTAPITQPVTLPEGEVERLEIVVPAGHFGLTGLALLIAGAQVIPDQEGIWLIADDEVISWPLERYPTTGAWAARTFNTDLFEHSWHLRYEVDRAAILPARQGPAILRL